MAHVPLKGSQFKHSLSESELSAAIAKIEVARVAANALLQKIAVEFKQQVPGLPAIQAFLNSADAKLCCALEAAKKRPCRHRPALDKVLCIPHLLDLKKPLPEIARLRVRMKNKGGLRFIYDYGPVRRSAQQMMLRVMQRIFVPQSFQQTRLQHTIGLAKAALLEGKRFYATLDIEDHNGSFSTKKLTKQLPVPKVWVDYVVGGRHAPTLTHSYASLCAAPPSPAGTSLRLNLLPDHSRVFGQLPAMGDDVKVHSVELRGQFSPAGK